MKEPRKDDERLSALLDGQVSGPERDQLLAHLAASDDDYEVFNDAVEMLGALEEEDARAEAAEQPAPVIPLRQPRRPWRPPARWVALAAVLAGVVLVSTLALRGRTGGDPVRLAAAVQPAGEQLPSGFPGDAPWPADRGAASSDLPPEAQAARAGAQMVQLAMAVRARDTAYTRLLATRVHRTFEGGIGGNTPLRQIAQRPDAPSAELERLLDEATDRLADSSDPDYLQLGAWVQAARVAASARDEAFFRGASSRKMVRRAERLTRDDPAAQATVGQVRGAWPADRMPEWDALEASLKDLLRAIAS